MSSEGSYQVKFPPVGTDLVFFLLFLFQIYKRI